MTQRSQGINAPVRSPTTGAFLDFREDGEAAGAIGRTASQVSQEEILAFTRELTNKLAWAMGTFYKVPYSGRQTVIQQYVMRATRAILRDHGYPN